MRNTQAIYPCIFSVSLSICLSIYLSFYISTYLSAYLSIHLQNHPCICTNKQFCYTDNYTEGHFTSKKQSRKPLYPQTISQEGHFTPNIQSRRPLYPQTFNQEGHFTTNKHRTCLIGVHLSISLSSF